MRALLLACLLLVPSSAYAIRPTAGTDITLYGGERLTSTGAATLRGLLTSMPTSLYPNLEAISVNSMPVPPSGTICEETYPGPCRINIWGGNDRDTENPFPSDAPEQVTVSGPYVVAAHELGHNIGGWARQHRRGWELELVREAGCEPQHYLRSMFNECFFHNYPQEFVASMINQWAACSECTLKLALARWNAGIPHPLNQAAYLMWLFGALPSGDVDSRAAHVLAYRERNGQPEVVIWTVRPWRCGGDVTIAGPMFALMLTLDTACRVTAVGGRDGI